MGRVLERFTSPWATFCLFLALLAPLAIIPPQERGLPVDEISVWVRNTFRNRFSSTDPVISGSSEVAPAHGLKLDSENDVLLRGHATLVRHPS